MFSSRDISIVFERFVAPPASPTPSCATTIFYEGETPETSPPASEAEYIGSKKGRREFEVIDVSSDEETSRLEPERKSPDKAYKTSSVYTLIPPYQPIDVQRKALVRFAKLYGKVQKTWITMKYDSTRDCYQSFGHIKYAKLEEAEEAVRDCDPEYRPRFSK